MVFVPRIYDGFSCIGFCVVFLFHRNEHQGTHTDRRIPWAPYYTHVLLFISRFRFLKQFLYRYATRLLYNMYMLFFLSFFMSLYIYIYLHIYRYRKYRCQNTDFSSIRSIWRDPITIHKVLLELKAFLASIRIKCVCKIFYFSETFFLMGSLSKQNNQKDDVLSIESF